MTTVSVISNSIVPLGEQCPSEGDEENQQSTSTPKPKKTWSNSISSGRGRSTIMALKDTSDNVRKSYMLGIMETQKEAGMALSAPWSVKFVLSMAPLVMAPVVLGFLGVAIQMAHAENTGYYSASPMVIVNVILSVYYFFKVSISFGIGSFTKLFSRKMIYMYTAGATYCLSNILITAFVPALGSATYLVLAKSQIALVLLMEACITCTMPSMLQQMTVVVLTLSCMSYVIYASAGNSKPLRVVPLFGAMLGNVMCATGDLSCQFFVKDATDPAETYVVDLALSTIQVFVAFAYLSVEAGMNGHNPFYGCFHGWTPYVGVLLAVSLGLARVVYVLAAKAFGAMRLNMAVSLDAGASYLMLVMLGFTSMDMLSLMMIGNVACVLILSVVHTLAVQAERVAVLNEVNDAVALSLGVKAKH